MEEVHNKEAEEDNEQLSEKKRPRLPEEEDNEQLLEKKLIRLLEQVNDEDLNDDKEEEAQKEKFPLWWRTIVHPVLLKHPTICAGCFKERASDFRENMSLCPVCLGKATRCSKCGTPFKTNAYLKDKCRPCKYEETLAMAREWQKTRQYPCLICGNGSELGGCPCCDIK